MSTLALPTEEEALTMPMDVLQGLGDDDDSVEEDQQQQLKPTVTAYELATTKLKMSPMIRRRTFGTTSKASTTIANMDDLLETSTAPRALLPTESLWNVSNTQNDNDDDDSAVSDDEEEEQDLAINGELPRDLLASKSTSTDDDDNVDDRSSVSFDNEIHAAATAATTTREIPGDQGVAASNTKPTNDDDDDAKDSRDDTSNDGDNSDLENESSDKENNADASKPTKQVKKSPPREQQRNEDDAVVEPPTKGKSSKTAAQQPDEDAVLASTDILFSQVTDKSTVTVKDITKSLAAEYNCKLNKTLKAVVRQRLTDLINGKAENNVDSDIGDDEESEDDADDEFAPEEEEKETKRNKQKTSKKGRTLRPKKANKAKLALRVRNEQLRKRRLEELRVRNEELMMHQSAKDQERAEQIAAKFETNGAESKLQRMENRLDLLEKLDHKRIACVAGGEPAAVKEETKEVTPPVVPPAREKSSNADESSDSSDDDDDDDLELELEGKQSLNFDPNAKPAGLALLDMADYLQKAKKHAGSGGLTLLAKTKKKATAASPRAALRHQLKRKQRDMGNRWLARELGYKTETEHLNDCLASEQKKREMILKREQERIAANQRAVLRERMLNADERMELQVGDDDEEKNEESKTGESAKTDEEEDEEMAMARELEEEEKLSSEQSAENSDASQDAIENSAPVSAASTTGNNEPPAPPSPSNTDSPAKTAAPLDDLAAFAEDTDFETQAPVVAAPAELKMNGEEASKTLDSIGGVTEDTVVEDNESPVFDDDDDDDDPFETQAPVPTDVATVPSVSIDSSDTKAESSVTEPSNNASDSDAAKAATKDGNDEEDALKDSDDEGDAEPDENVKAEATEEEAATKPKGPRNSAWQAMLQKEKEQAKKQKKSSLVEEEADEEEEEEVAGLEDFGFVVHKKKKEGDEDFDPGDIDEDDLANVVDDVSDDEGDEEAGEKARKAMEQKEEKERHKEMLRRMRDGYDGRRGGIAVGGAGARGLHRFDQLVAADNREDAKRLGLLNDDELDSDNEEGEKPDGADDEEEDEAALLDKMLKDRFLHRSSVEEENFSEDEEDEDEETTQDVGAVDKEQEEEKEQERLAKRFAKRARMQRLIEAYGHEEEFSQSKLIDEDTTLKLELQKMKNGLARKRSQSSTSSSSSSLGNSIAGKKKSNGSLTTSLFNRGGSLAIALQASRRSNKTRTSFVRNVSDGGTSTSSSEASSSFQKCIAFNHVVFHSNSNSRSQLSKSTGKGTLSNSSMLCPPPRAALSKPSNKRSASLFSKTVLAGFQKKRKV